MCVCVCVCDELEIYGHHYTEFVILLNAYIYFLLYNYKEI